MNTAVDRWLGCHDAEICCLARTLFEHPETAGEEHTAAQTLSSYLKEHGFLVEQGTAGLSTAFTARWGSEGPVIALLAEYDALPHLGQRPVPCQAPLPGNGHGCGHNLLGAGIVGAACAAAAALAQSGTPGRIVVFGCPEEEICRGKIVMADAGCFDAVDAALSWHPADRNQVSEDVFQAMVSRKFRFYGRTAHAAASPEQGRSALDAAELTNVAVNYLREHVPDDVRMHYVYTSAGDKPNVVPDYAEIWYYIRAYSTRVMRDAESRVILAAEGAAHATQTRMETEALTASPQTLLNHTLNKALYQCFTEAGAPIFSAEERTFARQLQQAMGLPDPTLLPGILPLTGRPRYVAGSTDVSAVSHRTPTVTLNTVCQVHGLPGHHWGVTACSGADLGMRGMLAAARTLGRFACTLCTDPALLAAARAEWENARQSP